MKKADLILDVKPASKQRIMPTGAVSSSDTTIPRQLTVWSKADLLAGAAQSSEVAARGEVLTSALTGDGIQQLVQRMVDLLVPEAKSGNDCLCYGVPLTYKQLEQVADFWRNQLPGEIQLLTWQDEQQTQQRLYEIFQATFWSVLISIFVLA
ncbi:MAG: hypothetical protein EBU26_14745, partial [Verrucomicrobia bacterium]|nr:hypothetical protein [Verrucomicrobiota bacterium]